MRLAVLSVLGILVLVFIAPMIYDFWVGELVHVPNSLTICMAIFFIVYVLYSPYNYFLNGTGKIKLHMYLFAFGAVINIPLSILLVRVFGLDVEGVILATVICIFPNVILFPIQYFKIIHNKASGIWAK